MGSAFFVFMMSVYMKRGVRVTDAYTYVSLRLDARVPHVYTSVCSGAVGKGKEF